MSIQLVLSLNDVHFWLIFFIWALFPRSVNINISVSCCRCMLSSHLTWEIISAVQTPKVRCINKCTHKHYAHTFLDTQVSIYKGRTSTSSVLKNIQTHFHRTCFLVELRTHYSFLKYDFYLNIVFFSSNFYMKLQRCIIIMCTGAALAGLEDLSYILLRK